MTNAIGKPGHAASAETLEDPEYLAFQSVGERRVNGHRLRDEVPLDTHAKWKATPARVDPLATLEAQSAQRMPDLIHIRYGRMAASPFAFFRGGAGIMAGDLATTPTSGLATQLCGDAHLLNFGFFATPDRTLIFGLNDFDETLPGPFEWDVKRLAASIEIAGRDLGFTKSERRSSVLATVQAYRESMTEFAEMRNLEVWYARLPAQDFKARLDELADPLSSAEADKRIRQSLKRDHLRAFNRLVERHGDSLRFKSAPPLLMPIEELLDTEQRDRYLEVVQECLRQYRSSMPADRQSLMESYRYLHMARKVVGVGSVGTRAWVVLFEGRDCDDPLLLQMKEAPPSVLAPYAGPSRFSSEGQRVVAGQRLMQAAGDHLLGHYDVVDWDGQRHDFYVRQLWDGKSSIDVTQLTPKGMQVYGESCGWTLARGHARAGDRVALAAYLGGDDTFEQAIAKFASAYADTNEEDHALLVGAVADGRLEATAGI